jgi:serine protease Do
MKKSSIAVLIFCFVASFCLAEDPPLTDADREGVIQKLSQSVVQVAYWLKYDQGESPYSNGATYTCNRCGSLHDVFDENFLKEDRPFEVVGFVVSDSRVVTLDYMIHPRFVKKIEIRFGNQTVPAEIDAYAVDQRSWVLSPKKDLKGIQPLKFERSTQPQQFVFNYQNVNGSWISELNPFTPSTLYKDGHPMVETPESSLIVTRAGDPIALSMNAEGSPTSWKQPFPEWKLISAKDYSKHLEGIEASTQKTLLRVSLHFRNPKKNSQTERADYNLEEEALKERNVVGLLLKDDQILVLEELQPNITSYLDRITVYTSDGKEQKAVFQKSLVDYGAFTARLEEPLKGTLVFADKDLSDFKNKLLWSAEVKVKGDQIESHIYHQRVYRFQPRWKNQVYPQIAESCQSSFLFDEEDRLVALPVSRRRKVSSSNPYERDIKATLTPAVYVKEAIDRQEFDPKNAPMSEENESRLAWLGVELQGLNEELARANHVSSYCNNGENGAIVTHVYSDSPAEKAGVKVGWVLLRIHVENEPMPINVKLMDRDEFVFPWDKLDQIPEQYYNRIPLPWSSVKNSVTDSLTSLGFGTKFKVELFHDDKLEMKEFEVVAGPHHYNSAPRYKSKSLGITVRDMTYEVRRYFQRSEKDPGVIISEVEPGSKASVSGIKPYEIITHVNDIPISNAKDFEKIAEQEKGDLRLSIKQMSKGKLIRITK